MHPYHCPECGKKIEDSFKVCIGGLFMSNDLEHNNPFTEYALLHDGVQINEFNLVNQLVPAGLFPDFINARETYRNIPVDTDENGVQSRYIPQDLWEQLQENHPECTQYLEILNQADTANLKIYLSYDMDPSYDPFDEKCIRYVFANLVVREINLAMQNNNRLVQYMLSAELKDQSEAQIRQGGWCNVDLKQLFTLDRLRLVMLELTFLEESAKLNANRDEAMRLISLLDGVDSCALNFDIERWGAPVFEPDSAGVQRLTYFTYGRQRGYRRICPKCGIHIASCLGMFPQKIVSFIGAPACGKSTLISAIYASLKYGRSEAGFGDTRHFDKVPGTSCYFGVHDPFYTEHEENYHNMADDNQANEKTDSRFFPSLTVRLTTPAADANGVKSQIYTFVDVPGEYFVPDTTNANNDEIDMHHLRIMQSSDMLCIVVAAEQLLGKSRSASTHPHSMAPTDFRDMQTLLNRLNTFREQILQGNTDVPMFFVVTKADEVKPKQDPKHNDFETREGVSVWSATADAPDPKNRVTQAEADKLYQLLTNPARDLTIAGTDVIDLAQLFTAQKLIHHFLSSIRRPQQTQQFISDLFQILRQNADWSAVPSFMVSAFGFYALVDIWTLATEKKIEALRNHVTVAEMENADEYIQLIADASPNDILIDIPEEKPQEHTPAYLQYVCKLSKKDLELIFTDYYRNDHLNDRTYGVTMLLIWVLLSTGMLSCTFSGEGAEEAQDEYVFRFVEANQREFLKLRDPAEWENAIRIVREIHKKKNDQRDAEKEIARLTQQEADIRQKIERTNAVFNRRERRRLQNELNEIQEKKVSINTALQGIARKLDSLRRELSRAGWDISTLT